MQDFPHVVPLTDLGGGRMGYQMEDLIGRLWKQTPNQKAMDRLTEAGREIAFGNKTVTEAQFGFIFHHEFYSSVGSIAMRDPEEATRELYRRILQREAEPFGIELYSGAIKSGRDIRNIVREISNSQENLEKTTAQLYLELLGRQPDELGLKPDFRKLVS